MQIRIVPALIVFVLGTGGIVAGQAAPPAQGGRGGGRGAQDTLVSPEVHPDRTVTFRIRAPQAHDGHADRRLAGDAGDRRPAARCR